MQIETAALDAVEHRGDLMRGHVVDVADEAQRQVIVFGIDPARARQAAAQRRQCLADSGRDFDAGEKPRHCRSPYCRSARARAISASTLGQIRATMTSTPAAV